MNKRTKKNNIKGEFKKTLKLKNKKKERKMIGGSDLYNAIENNNYFYTKNLLTKSNVPINQKNNFGFTPLYLAVQKDNQEIVKLLLNNEKINPNVVNNAGYTPLHLAVQNNNQEIVELLLNKNADPNVKNKADLTPLHLAVNNIEKSKENDGPVIIIRKTIIIINLIEKGAESQQELNDLINPPPKHPITDDIILNIILYAERNYIILYLYLNLLDDRQRTLIKTHKITFSTILDIIYKQSKNVDPDVSRKLEAIIKDKETYKYEYEYEVNKYILTYIFYISYDDKLNKLESSELEKMLKKENIENIEKISLSMDILYENKIASVANKLNPLLLNSNFNQENINLIKMISSVPLNL